MDSVEILWTMSDFYLQKSDYYLSLKNCNAFSMSSGVSMPMVSCWVMPTLILNPFSSQRSCSRLSAISSGD